MPAEKTLFSTPSIFSFIENYIDTYSYFNIIDAYINQYDSDLNTCIIFDFRKVETITIDAIMYMLAFIFREKKKSNISFAMTLPENNKLLRFFKNCGIHQFIENDFPVDESIKDYCIIKTASSVDVNMISKMYQYIIERSKTLTDVEKSRLYNIFVEIITNSVEHAYDCAENTPNWYCFIEDCGKYLKVTFLDVGKGIVKSIFSKQKGSVEDFSLLFGGIKYDTEKSFIYRALKGQIIRFNKDTMNRGKGLPEIYQFLNKSKNINNIRIISNNECLVFTKQKRNKKVSLIHLKNEFQGTLYYFEIKK